MAVQFNADFNRFVEFATAQNASGKAIADAVNGKFDVGGLTRSIEVASGDKVGAWFRSQTAKDVNNVTRDIFHNAVVSMFGGESKIPASVMNAMEMKNFGGAGRPLTAKRIMEVKAAIDQYNAENSGLGIDKDVPGANIIAEGLKANAAKMNGVKAMSAASTAKDMQPVALTQQKANKMIGKSLSLLGYSLSGDQKASLGAMLLKYGNNMPAKNQRVLSNYIANKAIRDGDVDEDDVASLAKDMKTWSEFKLGDTRLNRLSAKFIERQNTYVKNNFSKTEMFSEKNPDVFKQLYSDADRGDWSINGKKFRGSSADAVANEFLKVVKDPTARKVISILMNQGNLADMESLYSKLPALIGDANAANLQEENLHTISGGELFVSRSGMSPMVDANASYGLEISKDGKTATVTVAIDKDITTAKAQYNEYKIGVAKITQKTVIDLTKQPMPEVVDVKFSQTYSPDKIHYNPKVKLPQA